MDGDDLGRCCFVGLDLCDVMIGVEGIWLESPMSSCRLRAGEICRSDRDLVESFFYN